MSGQAGRTSSDDASGNELTGTGTVDAPPPPTRRTWLALTVCLAAGFMTMLDVSIVNVALPSIQASLHAGATATQLIVAGYSLAFGLALIPAGRLGDVRGRRPLFLIGLALFVAASALAGASTTEGMLSIARLLQGFGAGILNPQVIGLIQQLFRGPTRAKALGIFGATIGVSTAVGPLLGGVILDVLGPDTGWRWVFFINVPIVLIVIPAALRLLPKEQARHQGLKLDPIGLLLIAVMVLSAMWPFVTTTGTNDPPARWLMLIPAAVALAGLLVWELRYSQRVGEPVLDFGLLATPSFRYGMMLGIAYFAGFTSIFLVTMLYTQSGLHYNPLQAGLIAMPYAIASAITAWLSSRFVTRYGRITVVVALAIVLIGLVLTDAVARWWTGDAEGLALAATLLVCGIGGGCVIAPNQSLTLAEVPVLKGGTAAGLLQTGQRFGAALGTALVLAVFTSDAVSGGGTSAAYSKAFSSGLLVTIVLVALAMVVGFMDFARRRGQRERRHISDGAA